jgi:hypothetical protein
VFSGSDGQQYSFVFNAADDQDELYRLCTDADSQNCIDDPEMEQVRIEGIRTLSARMEADPRWFVYSQYLHLEHSELLPSGSGDRQLFVDNNDG